MYPSTKPTLRLPTTISLLPSALVVVLFEFASKVIEPVVFARTEVTVISDALFTEVTTQRPPKLPVPAVLQKLKSIHSKDIGSVKDFDSEQVLKFINNIILEERKKNPDLTHHHSNLGLRDVSIDDDNQDAWKGLMPVTK